MEWGIKRAIKIETTKTHSSQWTKYAVGQILRKYIKGS